MHHTHEMSPELLDQLRKQFPPAQKMDDDPVLREEAQRRQFGATKRFPQGKLTANDEGEIAFGVTTYKGKVVLNFGMPVASVGMDAQQAMALASTLKRKAKEIRHKQH
jgi:hypothetical protein